MPAKTATTEPLDPNGISTASRLAIAPAYTDIVTGATYVHEDLKQVRAPFEHEAHIPPITTTERFGDVESWANYVLQYGRPAFTLATWTERGLSATLDYHEADGTPGRCKWQAVHPFERSPQWKAWAALADGRPRSQREVLEAFEDLGEDIYDPEAAQLLSIVSAMRATASAEASTELHADGTTRVSYVKNKTVNAGEITLPPTIQISIPVLKGHVEPTGEGKTRPVLYRLAVRIRVSVDDSAHLAIRLSMPGAERALEAVFADRVAAAEEMLGTEYSLLRATAG